LFPLLGETRTEGHSVRVKGRYYATEMRGNFFSQRVLGLEFIAIEGSGG